MTPSEPITVALVDDQLLVRSGFRMLINSQPDMNVVAEASNGREALASPSLATADVILMDVRMPELDGIETTERLLTSKNQSRQAPRIIVLTTFDMDEYAFSAIQAGASGFLLKDAPPEELLESVRTVNRGDAVIAPSTTRRLLDHMAPLLKRSSQTDDTLMSAVGSLTPREREVFGHIALGRSNPEIARDLFLSEATVKTHVGHILAKLGARDRVQAVVIAYQTGVVSA
ncbi:DNA-binding response regulator [Arthrobacter sp. MYb229]|uniref:response regulator n=1 Tax=unclassified Arthrobacter TaxID=235627 RepID=UPI000CFDAAA8|nr:MULTISPECIES: response regulator transcription factor [unclassified Arthrobacter]PRA06980.1 DNA-binding response regulator [Arthrobacter sp. MYb229]PRB47928.1 DNA-binding response regulator [Arthrobacter sp. MYb216]